MPVRVESRRGAAAGLAGGAVVRGETWGESILEDVPCARSGGLGQGRAVDGAGGDADDGVAGVDVADDDGAGADGGALADADALDDAGAHADEGAGVDADAAGEPGGGADVDGVGHLALVV